SGHQFSIWAGQLGDGCMVSILVTPYPSEPNTTYELQLKGAGRTMFAPAQSPSLAILHSSIHEFLCAKGKSCSSPSCCFFSPYCDLFNTAMYTLSMPTTHSISLISLPVILVTCEHMKPACVLTGVTPSFIHFSFQPSHWNVFHQQQAAEC
ncbi:hypothetical protein NEOLEDRAFT_1069813, partial [Neolentinus lepideus HHB14362 ss-1]